MKYRITKECGAGWDAGSPAGAWGVSARQRRLAERVAPGDVFLHYIDGVHSWAGYSTVQSALRANDRDSEADWRAALPYVIPIEAGIWLNKHQCEQTVQVRGLKNKHYYRQRAFSIIQADDAKLIIAAIEAACAQTSEAAPAFLARWMIGAESYYKEIMKSLARGECQLCGETTKSWADRIQISMLELDEIRFLDAAHIIADCDSGPMTPDNLRALCPNCHRVVDRLSNALREKLLRDLKPRQT